MQECGLHRGERSGQSTVTPAPSRSAQSGADPPEGTAKAQEGETAKDACLDVLELPEAVRWLVHDAVHEAVGDQAGPADSDPGQPVVVGDQVLGRSGECDEATSEPLRPAATPIDSAAWPDSGGSTTAWRLSPGRPEASAAPWRCGSPQRAPPW